MTASPPRPRTHSNSDIAAILAELNATVIDHERLHAWASQSEIPLMRAVASERLTYVRLAGKDASGGYVVLMLLEGAWERAI